MLALEGLSSEREGARAAASEASHRASTLAAEVVGLEQALLSEKSSRLRAEAKGEAARATEARLEKKLGAAQQELAEVRKELEQMTLSRRDLLVKVREGGEGSCVGQGLLI